MIDFTSILRIRTLTNENSDQTPCGCVTTRSDMYRESYSLDQDAAMQGEGADRRGVRPIIVSYHPNNSRSHRPAFPSFSILIVFMMLISILWEFMFTNLLPLVLNVICPSMSQINLTDLASSQTPSNPNNQMLITQSLTLVLDPIRLTDSPSWTMGSLFQRDISTACAVAGESYIELETPATARAGGEESKEVGAPVSKFDLKDRG